MDHSSSKHQDKVMLQVMRRWLLKHDNSALMAPNFEPYLQRQLNTVRDLLEEFCDATSPNDLLVICFYHADRVISQLHHVEKAHLAGILIVSVAVTLKFYEDSGLSNSWLADACGIRLRDINNMERVFLSVLDYELMITTAQVNAFYQRSKRDWEERTTIYSSSTFLRSKSSSSLKQTPKSSPTSTPLSTKSNLPPVKRSSSSSSSHKSTSSASQKVKSTPPTSNTKSNSKPPRKSLIPNNHSITPSTKISKFTHSWKLLNFFRPSQ